MTLLDYHRLHGEEKESWDTDSLEAAVRAQEPGFPERVTKLFPPGDYKTSVAHGTAAFLRLHDLCQLWLRATPEQRTYIRSLVNWDRAFQLGGFQGEAARLAVQHRSVEWLRLALASGAIADLNIGDARDIIVAVNGLLAAARKIDADWTALMREQIALAGPAMTALLENHLRNHPK